MDWGDCGDRGGGGEVVGVVVLEEDGDVEDGEEEFVVEKGDVEDPHGEFPLVGLSSL